MLKTIALIIGIILPFFNIPLIYRITKRRSAEDVSLVWSLGILVCFILMQPHAVIGGEKIFALFNTINIFFLIIMNIQILRFHKPKSKNPKDESERHKS